MPLIANLTPEQLRAATKAQIITAISNYLAGLSKRQIITFLVDADRIPDAPVITRRPDGQPTSQVDVIRDAETGLMVEGLVTSWSYYPTGEVDEITISTRDADYKEVAMKTIKHFTDGRPPIVSEPTAREHIAAFLPVNPPAGRQKATQPNHAGITLKGASPMEKVLELIKSRKFWAAVAGLALIVVQEFMPTFPLNAEQMTNVIYVIVAFIVGTGLEDAGKGL